jgi:exonuclease III
MKILYWNVRGLANSPTRLALKNLLIAHKPDIVVISEPWMDFDLFPKRWLAIMNFKLFAVNTRVNKLPNIWCFCKTNLNPSILLSDDQHVSFTILDNDKLLAFAAVYASTNYVTRRKLWDALNTLQSQHNLPWSFLGEFNVILGAHEHRGRFSPARLPMSDFQAWTDNFQLIHLPTKGAEFTWNNGRGGSRHTEKRLDRVVCNQDWLDICQVSSVEALTKHKSDHFPLLFDFQTSIITFASNFKFMRMWSMHDDCRSIISECWKTELIGCPMFILNKKLKILKMKLKEWNKTCFGNINEAVVQADLNLKNVQHNIQSIGPTDMLLAEERQANIALEDALNKQEVFWQEKARLNWHLHGDRNTKYFHRLAKLKSSTKAITSLQDGANVLIDPVHISEHIVNYYKNLFSSNIALQDFVLVDEVIPQLVSSDVNVVLSQLPSHSEIKTAVFALNVDSAPGPDGFGAFFYQHYWDIVSNDVIKAVLQFFTSNWIMPGFNSNVIALLPKTPDASSIDQYRPIAMANFKFKIISKILADRLATVMPNIISEEQKGFIHDRNIRDCLCIAS